MGKAVSHLLQDTHILVLMDEPDLCSKMTQLLRAIGATVHHAHNQQAALGTYWRLFQAGVRPRAVITCWWLTKPGTPEHRFLRMLGREGDATSLNLLANIVDLDPSAFLTVYTRDPESAERTLVARGIGAQVVSQYTVNPANFVASVATHDGIACQRLTTADVARELVEVDRKITSGLYPSIRTPLPQAHTA